MDGTTYDQDPDIHELQYGGWLATTAPRTKIRIGVVGASEEEARARFRASLNRWKELSETEVVA
jgi:hypothetical protein